MHIMYSLTGPWQSHSTKSFMTDDTQSFEWSVSTSELVLKLAQGPFVRTLKTAHEGILFVEAEPASKDRHPESNAMQRSLWKS